MIDEKKEKKREGNEEKGKKMKGWEGETHGDGGSGKKKHRYGCDSFHDFAVGEDDTGILLGYHIEALFPNRRTQFLSYIAHTLSYQGGRNIFFFCALSGVRGVREKGKIK